MFMSTVVVSTVVHKKSLQVLHPSSVNPIVTASKTLLACRRPTDKMSLDFEIKIKNKYEII